MFNIWVSICLQSFLGIIMTNKMLDRKQQHACKASFMSKTQLAVNNELFFNTHAESVSCSAVQGWLLVQQVVLGDPPAVLLQVRVHVVLVVVHDWQGFLHAASLQGLLVLLHCGQKEFVRIENKDKELIKWIIWWFEYSSRPESLFLDLLMRVLCGELPSGSVSVSLLLPEYVHTCRALSCLKHRHEAF